MTLIERIIGFFLKNDNQIMYAQNKILIVGLGNIGDKYANTKHNIGFICADKIAEIHNSTFKDSRYGFVSDFKIKNKTVVLLKPSTFMNLSGNAIAYYMKKEKLSVEQIMVITDDIALPFGQIRIRKKGGAGGHNGLQNIIDVIETSQFNRIRVGIGNDFSKGSQSDYVLNQWDEDQEKNLIIIKETVAKICDTFVLSGIDIAMNKYNTRI